MITHRHIGLRISDGKSGGMHDVAGCGQGARNGWAEPCAVVTKHGEVLGHAWSVAGVDADSRELAHVELQGVAVQGDVLEGALGERRLRSRGVFDECSGWVLKNKPEYALEKAGSMSR